MKVLEDDEKETGSETDSSFERSGGYSQREMFEDCKGTTGERSLGNCLGFSGNDTAHNSMYWRSHRSSGRRRRWLRKDVEKERREALHPVTARDVSASVRRENADGRGRSCFGGYYSLTGDPGSCNQA